MTAAEDGITEATNALNARFSEWSAANQRIAQAALLLAARIVRADNPNVRFIHSYEDDESRDGSHVFAGYLDKHGKGMENPDGNVEDALWWPLNALDGSNVSTWINFNVPDRGFDVDLILETISLEPPMTRPEAIEGLRKIGKRFGLSES